MTKRNLLEAASLVSESASEDGTWKVRLISEGKGSSGIYTAELLENHHSAFDDVLSFKNHPTGWDGPETRDFTMIAGEIKGATWVEADERGLKAVYGNYLPDPEYRDKIERYKDKLGLSIFIEGSGYVDEATGDFIVDWFNPSDPYASLDVVIAPGARGKFLENARKVYDARRSESEKTPGIPPAERKDNEIMELEKVVEAVEALTAQVTALVADKESAKAQEAQVNADAQAVAEALEAFESAVKAIDEADLLAPQRESLLSAAKRGEDVAPLIESAKAVKAAALEAVQVNESHGRDFGGSANKSYTVAGWSN